MVTKKGRIKLRQKGSSGGSADGLEVEILSAENSGEGEVLDLAEVATDDLSCCRIEFLHARSDIAMTSAVKTIPTDAELFGPFVWD